MLTEAVFNAGLKRYQARRETPWKPEWVCYYFINDGDAPSFVVDVSEHYERKRARARLPRHPVRRPVNASAGRPTRLNSPLFRQLIESRDAQFGALAGVTWAEGVVVREPIARPTLLKTTVNIGIVCYASIGGSGIVATELGKTLASRGHTSTC